MPVRKQYLLSEDLNTLQLIAGCPFEDVKKSYRRLAFKLHPDKGGDAKQFSLVCDAYKRITDYGATQVKPEDIEKDRRMQQAQQTQWRPMWSTTTTSTTHTHIIFSVRL